jgi:2-polyprenyl-6-hydroxyphenyl methylase/3-demethylubiquinone-9 3-methyltransferase
MAQAEQFQQKSTIDPEDVARFDRLGEEWWSEDGAMAALHKLNPVRVAWLRDVICRHFPVEGRPRERYGAQPVRGLRVLDIGCGAGLLAEPLARLGAAVTAIDPAPRNIEVAKDHAALSGLAIDYRCATAEAVEAEGARFDIVLAMEVVEHVRDPAGFLRLAAAMVRPSGLLFASTLNRTLKSFAFAIVGAEYVLGWTARGTHDWRQFMTPRELESALVAAGLSVFEKTGVVFDPLAAKWRLALDLSINYILAARRPG